MNHWNKEKSFTPLDSKHLTGFTLLEILVVISIIIILTIVIFPNFRTGEKQSALLRSAHKLAQDIRRAQEMAMSAKEFQGKIPEGGYGIYLTYQGTSYILYADCNNNNQYDVVGAPCNLFPEKVEEIDFEKGIMIKNFSPWAPTTLKHITFTPPDPEIAVITDSSDYFQYSPYLDIVLCLITDSTKTKTIRINKAGLINVE